jgi:hypothetical protein
MIVVDDDWLIDDNVIERGLIVTMFVG